MNLAFNRLLRQTSFADQLPASSPARDLTLAEWVEARILPLRLAPPDVQRARVIGWVCELDRWQRFTLFKLITGELRLGVSRPGCGVCGRRARRGTGS